MRKKLLCLLLYCLFLPCSVYATETIENTFTEIQTALDHADLPRFERYVDIESLAKQGTDTFLTLLTKNGLNPNLPPVIAVLALSLATNPDNAPTLKSTIAHQASQFIRNGVSSGHFGGRKTTSDVPPIFAEASKGRKILSIAGKALAVKGKNALDVPVHIKDEGNGHTYSVKLRLEKGKVWRVTEIADLPSLADRIWKEATQYHE